DDARVAGFHREIRDACPITLIEHLLPGNAAIERAVHSAPLVAAPGVPQRADEHDVRVRWVDLDVTDVAGIGQPHVAPGSAAVGRLVDTIAVRHVAADVGLAGAHVDDLRVRGGDCDGAAARRLPDAAGTRAEVEGLPFRRVTRDGRYASTPMGTDAAPLQRPEQPRIHGIPPHRSAGVFLAPPEVRPAATNAHRSFPKCI